MCGELKEGFILVVGLGGVAGKRYLLLPCGGVLLSHLGLDGVDKLLWCDWCRKILMVGARWGGCEGG